jgi:tRNA threonylcarbamoyladenosine biosynthesis protein TsaB
MPQIEKMLAHAGVCASMIEAVAVSIGPGSFTGIRIGLATAKGLAYAWKKPLLGVPTLEALAFACPAGDAYVSPMLDAQKGNVYQALYRWEKGLLKNVWPVHIVSARQVVEDLTRLDTPVLVLGDGLSVCEEELSPHRDRLVAAPAHATFPRAGAVALLGLAAWQRGEGKEPIAVNPLYVRRPEAEELWEKRFGGIS